MEGREKRKTGERKICGRSSGSEVKANAMFRFPRGVIGFEKVKDFFFFSNDRIKPFMVMQSASTPSLGFICIDPFTIRPDYKIKIGREVGEMIQLEDPAKAMTLVIVTMSSDPTRMTANLLSPIVINRESGLGSQMVLESSDFNVSYPILRGIENEDLSIAI